MTAKKISEVKPAEPTGRVYLKTDGIELEAGSVEEAARLLELVRPRQHGLLGPQVTVADQKAIDAEAKRP